MLKYESAHRAGKHYYNAAIALQPSEQWSIVAILNNLQVAVSVINKVELARLQALGYTEDESKVFYVTYDYYIEAQARNYQLKDELIAKHNMEIE